MAYDEERAEAQVLDQLEAILRHVADELAAWRARALKAEADVKESGARSGGGAVGGAGGGGPDARNRVADLEQENKQLRLRVEAARMRVHDLLSRLTFLEEQAREPGGNGGGRGASGAGGAGGATGGAGGGR